MTASEPQQQPDIERPIDLQDVRNSDENRQDDEKRPEPAEDEPGVPAPQIEPAG
ncbi:hypothetical protein [Actinoplanes sp. NPDC023714]|uniref:hypothetical protein n=1 Tax=Actinoplanes sp. NPDC023714 TaxID=3154322 RepID=UPI0033CF833F